MSAPRLTPHQAEVLRRIARRCGRGPSTPESWIGSRAAVEHLIEKGYVQVVEVAYGPRGGQRRAIGLTDRGRQWATHTGRRP